MRPVTVSFTLSIGLPSRPLPQHFPGKKSGVAMAATIRLQPHKTRKYIEPPLARLAQIIRSGAPRALQNLPAHNNPSPFPRPSLERSRQEPHECHIPS
jgi:hypothetical protein